MTTAWTILRVSNPIELPVSVLEAKDHLNLSPNDFSQDDKLESLIQAATERLERDTDRQLLYADYDYSSEEFCDVILIPVKPLVDVTSVKYLDADGAEQTLDPSIYEVDLGRNAVKLAPGAEWPTTYTDPNAVRITLRAGYGVDSDDTPRLMKQAILLIVGKWFYDPGSEASALHSQEVAYNSIKSMMTRSTYP